MRDQMIKDISEIIKKHCLLYVGELAMSMFITPMATAIVDAGYVKLKDVRIDEEKIVDIINKEYIKSESGYVESGTLSKALATADVLRTEKKDEKFII